MFKTSSLAFMYQNRKLEMWFWKILFCMPHIFHSRSINLENIFCDLGIKNSLIPILFQQSLFTRLANDSDNIQRVPLASVSLLSLLSEFEGNAPYSYYHSKCEGNAPSMLLCKIVNCNCVSSFYWKLFSLYLAVNCYLIIM